MREYNIIDQCVKRDGKVCAICKENIENDLKLYKEYSALNKEIKRQKKELQQKIIAFRKKILIDIDHINPRSRGGENSIENYQVTHKKCNSRKGNKII